MKSKEICKRCAIVEAAISTIQEQGLAASSISKIASRAKVSPATIYIYFEDKDALLRELFLLVKKELSQAMLKDFNEADSIENSYHKMMRGYMSFALNESVHYGFYEQMANSPAQQLICANEGLEYFRPLLDRVQCAIQAGEVRELNLDFLEAFGIAPLRNLLKKHLAGSLELSDDDYERCLRLSWSTLSTP